jgi:3-oxoacyl-[acyl-carrier protein] reductase
MVQRMVDLGGRVAIVTGGGSGIGRAIALELGARGAAVVVNDLDEGSAERAAAGIREATGAAAVAAVGSVTSSEATDRVVAAAEAAFGRLDILVNNAGLTRDAWLHRMTDEQWDSVLDVVLRGSFLMCRSAARLLRPAADHHRKVVNIASIAGVYGAAGTTNYSSAKAGLIGLTKALAREWAPARVNVNAVAPGLVTNTRLADAMPDGLLERMVALTPIGRGGLPEDVAAAVAFLASSDADFVTGQVIELHGGLELIPAL